MAETHLGTRVEQNALALRIDSQVRTGIEIGLKKAALILASFQLLGYGWWDRSNLTLMESAFWLTPAFALIIVAIIPFRLLSSAPTLHWAIAALAVVASIRLIEGIVAAWNSPIEPDTPAIAFGLISLGILMSSLRVVWRIHERRNQSGGK